jgi:hypothetical protein
MSKHAAAIWHSCFSIAIAALGMCLLVGCQKPKTKQAEGLQPSISLAKKIELQVFVERGKYRIEHGGSTLDHEQLHATLHDIFNRSGAIHCSEDAILFDLVKPLSELGEQGVGDYRFIANDGSYAFFLPGFGLIGFDEKINHPSIIYRLENLKTGIPVGGLKRFCRIMVGGEAVLADLFPVMKAIHNSPCAIWSEDGMLTLYTGDPIDWSGQ